MAVACRRVLLDLAVRSGAALRSAAVGDLGADAVAASFDEIHAFQARHTVAAERTVRWSREHCGNIRVALMSRWKASAVIEGIFEESLFASRCVSACAVSYCVYMRSHSVPGMSALEQAAALSTEAQQRLRGLVKQLGLESRLTVHPEAASSAAGNVTVNTAGRSRCTPRQCGGLPV